MTFIVHPGIDIATGLNEISYSERFTPAEDTLTITLEKTPKHGLEVDINGSAQSPTTDYTILDNIITFVAALAAGDEVLVGYY